jgi:DNA-directed RNA polymerase specialized sigma24 family protein
LMLLYLDNYRQKEIAEILGITESNVATKVNRIKRNLRKKFSNY